MLAVLVALATLLVASCGVSDSGASYGDLVAVCSGTVVEGAVALEELEPPYKIASFAGAHPDYLRTGVRASTFANGHSVRPEWGADTGDEAGLVLCMDRISQHLERQCPAEASDGTTWTDDMFSARYDVTLRLAATAEVLDEGTFSASVTGCPFFSLYQDDAVDPLPNYETRSQALDDFVEPWVLD